MTGTAVNPLFRAVYLAKDGVRDVTLVIPWLSLKHQKLVYPNNVTFSSPSDQEAYGFHHGKRWKIKFRLVVGVVHTNYLEYVKRESNGRVKALILRYLNNWVVEIYCHKVIRLSDATQEYPNSIICNVHGVNPKFLEIGKKTIERQQSGKRVFTKGAYYIGKMVWSKGYKELLGLLKGHQKELAGLEVDLYGSGEDSNEVQEAFKKLQLVVRVHPGRDHADPVFHDYKVFLNPSTTDVVCTTTAEALAMGKTVVCANHTSNDFFKQFPNCRTYDNSRGFVEATNMALQEEPAELTDAHRHELSWEAATERFLRASSLQDETSTSKPPKRPSKLFASTSIDLRKNIEEASAYMHYVASGFEASRRAFGAIPGTLQPDEEQSKELGLQSPKTRSSSTKSSSF
ncbi:Digalactosyldiacylglycerol synthase 2, chloroplastic [Linum perenne]